MLAEIVLASAMVTPAYSADVDRVDPNDLQAVNALNESGTGALVCVNPVAHAMLAVDDKESEEIETPLGKVEALAKDISIIKNAVETGKDVGTATVEVSKTKEYSCLQLVVAAIAGFCVCMVSKLWSKTAAFFSAVNAVLKQVDENKKG